MLVLIVKCDHYISFCSYSFPFIFQAGPLESVKIPSDKEGRKRNYSFIKFRHDVSVAYTIELMNGIRLFGRPLKLQTRSGSSSSTPGADRSRSFQSQQGMTPPGQFPPPIHRSGTWPSLPQNQSTPNPPPSRWNSNTATPESMGRSVGRDSSFHRSNSMDFGSDNRNHNRRGSVDKEYRQGNNDRDFRQGNSEPRRNSNNGMTFEMQRQRVLQQQASMAQHMQPNQRYRNHSQNHGQQSPWQQQQGGRYRY